MNEKTLHVVRGSANKWALSRAAIFSGTGCVGGNTV